MPSSQSAEVIRGVAETLARCYPWIWMRLLDEHEPDHLGHCRTCRKPVWPCTLRVVAELAKELRNPAELHHSPMSSIPVPGPGRTPPAASQPGVSDGAKKLIA